MATIQLALASVAVAALLLTRALSIPARRAHVAAMSASEAVADAPVSGWIIQVAGC
jgi:hypothetical protein